MSEYIDREALCYQLAKQATIDGQPRAIKRAAKIVADFPAADVRPAVLCRDCEWYDGRPWKNNETGICARTDVGVRKDDFCSYGEKKEER